MNNLLRKLLKPTRSTPANIALVSMAGLVLLIVITVFLLPNIVRATATSWLTDKGFTSSIKEIEISLYDSLVEISGVKATNADGKEFTVGKVHLDFSWYPLSDKQFVITGIVLADTSLSVSQHNDDLLISGISLKSDAPDSVEETTAVATEVIDATDLPWNVSLEELQLSNINVCYQQTVDDSKTSEISTLHDLCFFLGDLHWQGDVDYTLTDDQTKHPFHINGEIILKDIALINNHFDARSLSYEYVKLGQIELLLHDEPDPKIPTLLPLKADKLLLSGLDACFQKSITDKITSPFDGYCFKFSQFNWAGASGYSPAGVSAEEALLYVDGTLSLNEITVTNTHLQRNALSISELRFDKILINSLYDINLSEFTIHNLAALQKGKGSKHNVLGFEKLSIAPISVKKQNSLTVDKISLDGLQVAYEVLKNGELEHELWLPKKNNSEAKADAASSKQSDKQAAAFNYLIKSINITNGKTLSFTDNSLATPFAADINNTEITLGEIDSSKPTQKTQLDLKTKIYEHGSLKTEGVISPLSDKLIFNIHGELRALDLRKFNPYVKSSISHIIESGQLDSDLKLVSEAGQLDSNVDLTLHHFELEPLSEEATEEINDIFGLPLNSSLALIRERDGSININVDIEGDAENPDINPIEIATKAISTSIAKAVVVLYSPYGLIVGADMLFSLATALEFDPVLFDAGSKKINVSNAEEFTNLSKLLKDKPQVHIQICGFTNEKDILELFEIDTKKEKDATLNDEQLGKLVALAKNRAAATKRHLIENENVAADRIIVCTHKKKGAGFSEISGVEISI